MGKKPKSAGPMGKETHKEWWFRDALGNSEKKLDTQTGITPQMVEFYEGRLYQKEVTEPTPHNEWVPVKKP
jgi:hypothetical protein